MRLRIVYDNDAEEGFRKGWGFSCLVGEELLFDTGADLSSLLYNMCRFGVELERISKILLSHEHGDHIGGIRILERLGRTEVFVPRSFSSCFKEWVRSHPNAEHVEIAAKQEICQGIFTTGKLGSGLKEQSLIVQTENGLTLITGCAHPGLEDILRSTSEFGKVCGVVGSFHGFDRLDVLKRMHLILSCHFTTHKKAILSLYPESSVKCSVGCVVEI
ncbi:MBL fold metallo-hydrolase [Candidatus Bathyarchaeota archaeon]|nr:MBL fold metallo-hydrolase [Candidatus Bathyarchaeota archaeon]